MASVYLKLNWGSVIVGSRSFDCDLQTTTSSMVGYDKPVCVLHREFIGHHTRGIQRGLYGCMFW